MSGTNTICIATVLLETGMVPMAVLQAGGLMGQGDQLIHESIIGSSFAGEILEVVSAHGRTAIIPQITRRAWLTGQHSYFLDAENPWQEIYVVTDTWGVPPACRDRCWRRPAFVQNPIAEAAGNL